MPRTLQPPIPAPPVRPPAVLRARSRLPARTRTARRRRVRARRRLSTPVATEALCCGLSLQPRTAATSWAPTTARMTRPEEPSSTSDGVPVTPNCSANRPRPRRPLTRSQERSSSRLRRPPTEERPRPGAVWLRRAGGPGTSRARTCTHRSPATRTAPLSTPWHRGAARGSSSLRRRWPARGRGAPGGAGSAAARAAHSWLRPPRPQPVAGPRYATARGARPQPKRRSGDGRAPRSGPSRPALCCATGASGRRRTGPLLRSTRTGPGDPRPGCAPVGPKRPRATLCRPMPRKRRSSRTASVSQ